MRKNPKTKRRMKEKLKAGSGKSGQETKKKKKRQGGEEGKGGGAGGRAVPRNEFRGNKRSEKAKEWLLQLRIKRHENMGVGLIKKQ